jgi:hypothetical protein
MGSLMRARVCLASLSAALAALPACGGEVSGANSDAAGQDVAADASAAKDATSESGSDVVASEAGSPDVVTRDVTSDVPPMTFACASKTCTAPSQFCYLVAGGPPPPPDASLEGREHCEPMPPGCESKPTCACIRASVHLCATSCMQAGDEITIVCDAP